MHIFIYRNYYIFYMYIPKYINVVCSLRTGLWYSVTSRCVFPRETVTYSHFSLTRAPHPLFSISGVPEISCSWSDHLYPVILLSVVSPGSVLTCKGLGLDTSDDSMQSWSLWSQFLTWYDPAPSLHLWSSRCRFLYSWVVFGSVYKPYFCSISQLLWMEKQWQCLRKCPWGRVLSPLGICQGVV